MSDSPTAAFAAPPALKPGDGVSIVAPASSPRQATFESAMAAFTAAGYGPKVYRDFCDAGGYLAGSDAERIDELEAAFRDPETSMVLAVRGGYGCGRILDGVDFDLLGSRPKIVCGYSDLTALHAAVQHRTGLLSFHGPNLAFGLGGSGESTEAERRATLELLTGMSGPGTNLLGTEASVEPITAGVAEGRLAGGNLAVLMSLVGTPWEPELDGSILLLEDTGESTYRIDRLLTQLADSGRLAKIAGAVLGYFSKTGDGPPVDAVLREFFEPLGIPVVTGAAVGHEHPNLPMPLGARVRLDASNGRLELLQPVVTV